MLWFFSALFAGLFRTGSYTVNKKLLKNIDSITLTTLTSLFVLVLYTPFFILSLSKSPTLSTSNWAYLSALGSVACNCLAAFLLLQGLKFGEMSITIPLRNTVPFFVLFWNLFFFREPVTQTILIATIAIVAGTILLHYRKDWKKMFKTKASFFAIGAAISFSVAVMLDKFSTGFIRPTLYTYLIYAGMFLFFLLFNIVSKKLSLLVAYLKKNWKGLTILSVLAGLGTFFTFQAISLTEVTKVAPVLRMEVLMSVFAGGMFFKEKYMLAKTAGALLLLAGVLLIIV